MTFSFGQKVMVTLLFGYEMKGTVIKDMGDTVYVHVGSYNYEYPKSSVR